MVVPTNPRFFHKQPIYENIPDKPSCHCSSLIYLPDGKLWCAFFAGQYEKSPDVGIWASKLEYSIKTPPSPSYNWSPPETIIKVPDHSMGSPVFYLTPKGKLYLFIQVVHRGKIIKPGWSVANIQFITSDDNGAHWSSPQFLRKLWFWIIRCPPIVTADGSVLLPAHREILSYQGMVYRNSSKELDKPWKRYGRFNAPKGALEPTLVRLPNDEILCLLRTKNGFLYSCKSQDHGIHWTKPVKTSFPNPNSQCCLICLQSGAILLAFNNTSKGRSPLSIAYSKNSGISWDIIKNIEEEPDAEFSYPNLLQTPDGMIHLSYTWKRKKIYHCCFSESWIVEH